MPANEDYEEDAELWAWEAFAQAHPREAHKQDRERFIAYCKRRNPKAMRAEIDALVSEIEE